MTATVDIEDAPALVSYLRNHGYIGREESPVVEVLAGGVSCRTVLVDRGDGSPWVIKQALPRLRVEVEWLSDPARIHREALGMEWLVEMTPPGAIASLVFEDRNQDLVAMEAVPRPHEQWKAMLLEGRLDFDHVRQFGELLAAIHTGSRRLPQVQSVFADRSFFESLRIEPYYLYSGEQEPAAAGFVARLVDETRQHAVCLVHGDYSPKNVLVYRGRLVLLDHEVLHWGDGAFDIGFSTTHLLAKALHLPDRRGRFLDAARHYWETYQSAVEGPMKEPEYEARAVRHVIGCVLARSVGRSKLEYLSVEERETFAAAAVSMSMDPAATFAAAVDDYAAAIS